ncbi:hypothetical protein [Marinobacterium arenosum]|uniref:hypothetical protein n=1 Tax=Marinobacterium arenosum TaxID=2862496 RepID=UPI001C9760BC|nr:hypothetical protein [Marinobacterium arenosum]MBY4676582.1 hypothetical protein [Marinobacterium arenosum]
MKRNLIILLIAACVGVTWYINSTQKGLDAALKSAVEQDILADERFPARPVWWEGDKVLAVGVVPQQGSENHDADAEKVCRILHKHGIGELLVEVYDVLKIQSEDDWQRIGSSRCPSLP